MAFFSLMKDEQSKPSEKPTTPAVKQVEERDSHQASDV
jgi:hypothetical protein